MTEKRIELHTVGGFGVAQRACGDERVHVYCSEVTESTLGVRRVKGVASIIPGDMRGQIIAEDEVRSSITEWVKRDLSNQVEVFWPGMPVAQTA